MFDVRANNRVLRSGLAKSLSHLFSYALLEFCNKSRFAFCAIGAEVNQSAANRRARNETYGGGIIIFQPSTHAMSQRLWIFAF